MLKQTIIFAAIAGLVFALAPAAQAAFPDAPVAGPYHWAFITSGHTQATNTTIEYYDGFVQGLADTAGIGSVDWVVIGAIDGMNAKDHAPISGPVFLLNGTKVADGFAHMWSGTPLHHAIDLDENLNLLRDQYVFTGTASDGTDASTQDLITVPKWSEAYDHGGGPLNLGSPRRTVIGSSDRNTGADWVQRTTQYGDEYNPVYGLSEVLPEPATAALLLLGLPFVMRRRRRS